jgi:HEAT repeat protein
VSAVLALSKTILSDPNWAIRVLAAEALGRLGQRDGDDASKLLLDAIGQDPYALVRQASLEALASFDAPRALAIARKIATTDPEPRVREAAARMAR